MAAAVPTSGATTETGVDNELGEESARTFPIDEEFVLGAVGIGLVIASSLPRGPAVVVHYRGQMHGVFEIPRGMVARLLGSR